MIALFATPVPASPNMAAMGTAVAMLYAYIWIFSATLDNALVVYLPELFPTHLRAKGMALGIASLDLTDLILLQISPVAIRAIGWRYYLLFISVSAAALFWAWFQVPETKGLPLEKIAELFGEETEQVRPEKDGHVEQIERAGTGKDDVKVSVDV
ncbi:uncharacterized protein LTR77_005128 [Saxophila tyrrhenica]|uniref:Major facilitator superfamily (MFS) profile domain-containing protein n=1 Tax=Saxophila tyrrhenica TaxID=1690608 RepID=A0AAV9PEB7_9PEZI|nr:hypothetical protein LTR77_005128 [Saxophila tyrrhenica]